MRKLKEEELLAQVDYWGGECRNCAEHHNYSCETGCPHQPRCEQTYQQIRELIQKPEVTEEWIEEKAKELITMVSDLYPYEGSPCVVPKNKAKDFIRSFVEQMPAKKMTVTEGFVEKWTDKFDAFIYNNPGLIINIDWIKRMLTEAGVEVIKK